MLNLRRVKPALWIAAALCVALPASASGAATIGSTFAFTFGCVGPATYFQQADEGAPSYAVPAGGGVITSWSVNSPTAGAQVALGVFRATGTPGRFTTVAASEPETFSAAGAQSFPTRAPAQAGDRIGVLITSGVFNCGGPLGAAGDIGQRDAAAVHGVNETFTYTDDNANTFINVAASVEADTDGDGFGDETQDECTTDANRQTECVPPQTKIKKRPKNKIDTTKAKYKFKSGEPGSTFECKLDKKKFKPCTSPKKVKRLKEGKHKFKVRAIDAAGNVDPTPAKDKFKVVD
jgi:hypothetical protein